jgi:hypothetical protein
MEWSPDGGVLGELVMCVECPHLAWHARQEFRHYRSIDVLVRITLAPKALE